MVIAKASSQNSVVKSVHHLPANPDEGLTSGSLTGLLQLPAKSKRVNGEKYIHKGNVCMWRNGKVCCEHGRLKYSCKECGGSAICEHGREKSQCKECDGSGICEHGRQKRYCKECGGSGIWHM